MSNSKSIMSKSGLPLEYAQNYYKHKPSSNYKAQENKMEEILSS